MKIIDEYRFITEQIALLKSQITTAARELTKLSMAYRPSEVSGIDYGERVQSSLYQTPVIETAEAIIRTQQQIQLLNAELESWQKQRDELEKSINEIGEPNNKIIMLKIKGMKHWQIAREVHFSKSWVDKVCREYNKIC